MGFREFFGLAPDEQELERAVKEHTCRAAIVQGAIAPWIG